MTAQFGFPEWLSFCFFSFFLFLALLRPLEWMRRLKVTVLAGTALGLLSLLLGKQSEFVSLQRTLPLILLPMAYWQTAQFMAPVNQRLQQMLAEIDRKILCALENIPLSARLRRWSMAYFEVAYLLVYPMVPSGLAVLYFAGAIDRAGEFWTVVLPPTYLCYATLPFVRTLPPRTLEEPEGGNQRSGIQAFNLSVIRRVTHQANTFPSGHSAAATAVALELLLVAPLIGTIYVAIAFSIVVGAFVGRYHYAADLLLGAVFALIAFLLAAF